MEEGSGYKGWDSTSELERAMSGMSKETFMQVLKDVQKQLGLSDEEMAQKIMKFVNSGVEEEKTDMLEEMGAAEEEAEAASFASQAKGAAATKGGSEQADAFYEGEEPMEEKKTERYDAEMKEKGFSDAQADELPDGLQKAMLQTEVRAMIEEMLKGEGEKTLEGKRPPSMRKRTMKDLDKEAETRETDFLKKKKGEKKEELRKMNEEMLCEECGGVHEGTCPGK